ncbi:MAG TPA: TIGR00730 family Rossman fold protein [Ktedonobacteraceae bacterium]|nr:TIGR00730 family Rossman fold protein [Ktedonobacteraceae bacterium]
MSRICVFAGSSMGVRKEYEEAARTLGHELATRGLGLVYGGASVGLMGVMADAVLAEGGEVIGVLPRGLFKREVGHEHLTQLHMVNSMHERKALMADLADGFIALPGGYGTFDELFEAITWAQIGLHSKPIGLLNVMRYFDPLLALIAHVTTEGFIPASSSRLVLQKEKPGELLEAFAAYIPAIQLPPPVPPLER